MKTYSLTFIVLLLMGAGHSSAQEAQHHSIKIIPRPSQVSPYGASLILRENTAVYIDPDSGLEPEYVDDLLKDIGILPEYKKKERRAKLVLKLNKERFPTNTESYRLGVSAPGKENRIVASAGSKQGLLYALQTLRQLAEKEDGRVSFPTCEIVDTPAFPWRAYMLDESRHFHGKEMVKRLLDEMARLKLNTFHWHLVDDPAWRLEIKKYPLLTAVSSKGDYTHMAKGITPAGWDSIYNSKPGLYYTQEDIREIVNYADDRGILIIPEIEVPGHASASIYAYPWLGASSKKAGKGIQGDLYDVTDPRVEKFLHDVLDEVMALFPGGIVHIGGDEANYTHWQNSEEINSFMKTRAIPTYSDLQVWAINGMSNYISSKGYRMIGWNEITGDNIRESEHIQASQSEQLAPGTLVQFWDGDVSLINKAIEKGFEVVNSNRFYTYLDYPYETTSLEKAYSFNPVPEGISEKDRKMILGLGCQMWTEFVPTADRLYYQTFPRIAALAECGWVDPGQKTSYADFLDRFERIEKLWKDKGYLNDQPYR